MVISIGISAASKGQCNEVDSTTGLVKLALRSEVIAQFLHQSKLYSYNLHLNLLPSLKAAEKMAVLAVLPLAG